MSKLASSLPLHVVRVVHAAPDRIETAEQLAPRIGRTQAWIVEHTGVRERRIAEPDCDLAVFAAGVAREAAGGQRPDLLLFAASAARQTLPDSAVFIQRELGWSGVPAFSLHATCASFPVALHAASCYLAAGTYQRILICSAELTSRVRNLAEPESAALLGDGAAAALIDGRADGGRLLRFRMESWSEGAELAEIRGGGLRLHPNDPRTRPEDNLFHMDGPRVFRLTARRIRGFLEALLGDECSPQEVELVVPHQASQRVFEFLPKLGFPPERTVRILDRYGNCAAASTPMALACAVAEGRVRRGDRVLLFATGAGLTLAGALIQW